MATDKMTMLCEATPEQLDRVEAAAKAAGHPSLRAAANGDGGSTGMWGWSVEKCLEHFSAEMEDQAVVDGEPA